MITHASLKGKNVGAVIKGIFHGRFTISVLNASVIVIIPNKTIMACVVCPVQQRLSIFSFVQALQPLPLRDQAADSSSINTVFLYVNLEISRLRWLLISLDCSCWRLQFFSTALFHRHSCLFANDEHKYIWRKRSCKWCCCGDAGLGCIA